MTIIYNQWAEDRATLWLFAEHDGKPAMVEVDAQSSPNWGGWRRNKVAAQEFDGRDSGNRAYITIRDGFKTVKGLPGWATQEWAMRMLTEGFKQLDKAAWLEAEFSYC